MATHWILALGRVLVRTSLNEAYVATAAAMRNTDATAFVAVEDELVSVIVICLLFVTSLRLLETWFEIVSR